MRGYERLAPGKWHSAHYPSHSRPLTTPRPQKTPYSHRCVLRHGQEEPRSASVVGKACSVLAAIPSVPCGVMGTRGGMVIGSGDTAQQVPPPMKCAIERAASWPLASKPRTELAAKVIHPLVALAPFYVRRWAPVILDQRLRRGGLHPSNLRIPRVNGAIGSGPCSGCGAGHRPGLRRGPLAEVRRGPACPGWARYVWSEGCVLPGRMPPVGLGAGIWPNWWLWVAPCGGLGVRSSGRNAGLVGRLAAA